MWDEANDDVDYQDEPDYDDDFSDEPDPDDTERNPMQIGTWVTGSCSAYAIANLGTQANPLAAMKTFCRASLGAVKGTSRWGTPTFNLLAAHYIWTAGPEEAGKGHSKRWTAYGTEFAKFITDNNLGVVTTLPAVVNLKHHPDTTCQVWVWQPNQANMEAWWNGILEDLKLNPPKVSKYRASIQSTDRCPTCTYARSAHDFEYWTCPYGGEWPDKLDEDFKKEAPRPPQTAQAVYIRVGG